MAVADYSSFELRPHHAPNPSALVGEHPLLLEAKRLTERSRGLRILFWGETGTGKTPFARYSNYLLSTGHRRLRPFEQVNCACLNPEHFQDIMFGHKRGAFTGAFTDKTGLVELARGGDLFLDEIGDMPFTTQSHLLTFLDSQEYYRLGDDQKRRADVRILTATNRDLMQMVQQGQFRQDLYSRLSQVVVRVPALRERHEDIPTLIDYFISQFSPYQKTCSRELLEQLQNYSWHNGNVRELRDVMEFLCTMAQDSPQIQLKHLSGRRLQEQITLALRPEEISVKEVMDKGLENYMLELEDQVLRATLHNRRPKLGPLASALKISRSTLYRKLKRLGVTL